MDGVTLAQYISKPQAPSILMHVVFQLLLAIYNAYLHNQQLRCITLVPQGRSVASFTPHKTKKSYHLPLPVLLLTNFEPKTSAWLHPIFDLMKHAHPANRKIINSLLGGAKNMTLDFI
jgi:hypothetical protein